MDVEKIINTYPFEKIVEEITQLAHQHDSESVNMLAQFLEIRSSETYDKHDIPYVVCQALLLKGKKGLTKLVEILEKLDDHIYTQAIIRSIWSASRGIAVENSALRPVISVLNEPLPEETISQAEEVFLSLVLKSHTDPEAFYRLINFMFFETFQSAKSESDYKEFHKSIFNVLSDSAIKISKDVILGLEKIVQEENREEVYQDYIKKNPVLLDPLASRIINKHKLGDDYITDFVVKTLKGEYLLVEIEKPQDSIFTKSGDFSSPFSHAFGQVLDFIEWVESDIAYAEKKLPGISSPQGLLIMGRRKNMPDESQKKLQRFNKNSNSVKVLTYDDVIANANSLYKNIRKQIALES